MDGALPAFREPALPEASGGTDPLEEAITAKAKSFELPALVRLLRQKFPDRPLRFTSLPSLVLQASLVHAVEFVPQVAFAPAPILITLNLGLRSVTSPLASYFLELFAHPGVGPELALVTQLLDQQLLSDFAESFSPMQNERLVARPAAFAADALALARPGSPMTLGWLFRKVFPELAITVRRGGHERRLPAPDARLGQAVVGYAALGGEAEVKVPGMDALLVTDSSRTWHGEAWAKEARARLAAHVLPALTGAAIHLRVLLVDREALGKLIVRGPGELGFDPLTKARSPEVTTLFEGSPPRAHG